MFVDGCRHAICTIYVVSGVRNVPPCRYLERSSTNLVPSSIIMQKCTAAAVNGRFA